ncbi:MAG: alpha/beta fold hydrolase [Acidobacteriota bacterium]|jgi:pimeloyl-ACP methyl ester carboxylesterase
MLVPAALWKTTLTILAMTLVPGLPAASGVTGTAPGGTLQQLVSFPTADGGVVYADVYGSGERGVVLAHGGRFTKESWAEQAPVLAAAGFRVVAIDFRGRGQSHGGPDSDNGDAYYDVLAAVSWLRSQGATSVAVVGASFGGGAAAQAAVEAGPGVIDRLVLLAHSPIDEPEQMPGAKLFIVARDDVYGNGTPRLVDIRDQYERAPGPKELVVLEGSAHAQFLFDTDQAQRLMDEILRFLSPPSR